MSEGNAGRCMCAGETVNIIYNNINILCTLAVGAEATSAGPATGGIVLVEGVAIFTILSSAKQNIKRTLKVVILFLFYMVVTRVLLCRCGLRRTRVPG